MKNQGDFNQLNKIILLIIVSAGFVSCAPNLANNKNSNIKNNSISINDFDSKNSLEGNTNSGIIKGAPVSVIDKISRSTVAIFKNDSLMCTGTLINSSMIITASHCNLTNPDFDYYVGFSLMLPNENIKIEKRKILKQIRHPRFLSLTLHEMADENFKDLADISVALFEGEAPVNYEPALLLQDSKYLFEGQSVSIAGFGLINSSTYPDKFEYASQLMKINVLIKDPKYGKTEFTIKDPAGKGVCEGDSGGPTFIPTSVMDSNTKRQNKLVLAGVTSRSITLSGHQRCNGGFVQVSIPAHLEFIKKSIKSLNEYRLKLKNDIYMALGN